MKNTYLAALWLTEKTVIGICLAAMLTCYGILFLGSLAYHFGSRCRRTVNTVNRTTAKATLHCSPITRIAFSW